VVEGGGLCSHVRPFAGQRPDYLCRKMILRGGAGVGVGALRMVAGSPNTISAVRGKRGAGGTLFPHLLSLQHDTPPLTRDLRGVSVAAGSCQARLRKRTRHPSTRSGPLRASWSSALPGKEVAACSRWLCVCVCVCVCFHACTFLCHKSAACT